MNSPAEMGEPLPASPPAGLDAIIALGTLSAELAARGLEGSHFRVN
jgi:hypothetical protein